MEEETDPRVNVNSPNEEDRSMKEEEKTDPRFQDKSPTKKMIPMAPYFQAEIPQDIGNYVNEPETEKFLVNTIWPIENWDNDDPIGKGRPNACTCPDPNTLPCVKTHVTEEKARLRDELGAAFREWKFDEMGDDALLKWSTEDIETIEDIVDTVPTWNIEELVKFASKVLYQSKNRANIVNYLYDIVVPKKIGAKTREVDTDDELLSNGAALPRPEKKRRQLYTSYSS